MSIRRALLIAAIDRYLTLVTGFALVAIMSRVLTPAEIGVSVLGTTVVGIIELIRDVPSSFIVQRQDITRREVRAATTIMLCATLLAAGGMLASAHWVAELRGDPQLVPYVVVLAASLLFGPIERPQMALLRRKLRFEKLAVINVASIATNAVVTVGLALAGYSYLSFAWGLFASVAVFAVLAFAFNPQPWVYLPAFSPWRDAIRLSAYASAWALVRKVTEAVPYLVLSRQASLNPLGYFGRAVSVADIPDKMILAGVGPVAFPAIAAEHNAGRDLKRAMLVAMSFITAVAWPAFLLLACLAHPAVKLLLGAQWTPIVPILQVLSLAKLFMFFDALTFPVLFTTGALRSLVGSALVPLPFYGLLVWATLGGGPMALAWCVLAVGPVACMAGLVALRRAVPFGWMELLRSLRQSALVTLCSMVGPVAYVLLRGHGFELDLLDAVPVLLLAAIGWFIGLRLTGHPLQQEVDRLVALLRKGPFSALRKLTGR